jgi:ABC-type multidrug transport system permease subunit
MTKIPAIIAKNLKILMRSRVSSLIIIFGPLFLTLFVGLAFSNTSLTSIKVGVYAPTYNELVNSFVDKTIEAKLSVIKFETEEACADSIKYGTVNICMVFDKDFEVAKTDSASANNMITFYVDPSQMNLVYSVIDLISSQVEMRREELSTELTEIIITTLENARVRISANEPLYTDVIKSNTLVKTKSDSITSKLSGMNLSFDANTFGSGVIDEVTTNLSKAVSGNTSSTSLQRKLNDSLLKLNTIQSVVGGSELNDSIGDDITELESKLTSVRNSIATIDDRLLPQLEAAVDAMNEELDATTTKFAQIESSRDQIVSRDLKEISAAVSSILTNVMKLKSDSDATKQEIDAISVRETSSIVSPIRTTIKPLVSDTYLNYMFPSLICLVVMLVTILFAQTIVMIERRSTAYFRNLVTPTNEWVFVFSNFLTTVILLTVQVFLILGVSIVVFKVDILANFFPTMTILLMIITLFTILGITIGTLFASAETATLAAVSAGSMMLFLSDVILPLESMPAYIQMVARFNPFVIGEHILRNTIIFKIPVLSLFTENYSLGDIPPIFIMLIYIVVTLVILIISHILATRGAVRRKTAPKKLKKGQIPLETEDLAGDPVEKIETLLKTTNELLNEKEYAKVGLAYVHLNELYARLPNESKKDYFKKIVKIHQELTRYHAGEKEKGAEKSAK